MKAKIDAAETQMQVSKMEKDQLANELQAKEQIIESQAQELLLLRRVFAEKAKLV